MTQRLPNSKHAHAVFDKSKSSFKSPEVTILIMQTFLNKSKAPIHILFMHFVLKQKTISLTHKTSTKTCLLCVITYFAAESKEHN